MLMLNRWQGKQNYRLPLAAAFVISDIHLGGGGMGGVSAALSGSTAQDG